MKRIVFFAIIVFLFASGILHAGDISGTLRAGYFFPTDQDFKDIYGSGMTFGGELSFDIGRKVSLWTGFNYYSKKGELTFTKEEIKLEILPVLLGVRIEFSKRKLIPYLGVGVSLNFFSESVLRETLKDTKLGFFGEAGLLIKVIEKLYFKCDVNYSHCQVNPVNADISIGGFGMGAGLKYVF